MRLKIIFSALLLSFALNVSAQQNEPRNAPPKTTDEAATSDQKDASKNANQTPATYVRPDKRERQKNFVNSLIGPYALARTVVSAGYSTARNSPEEWGGQWEGFGRRVASGFGKNAIKQTTIFALDESFKLDSKFYRSKNRSFGAKVKNALISPVTARRADGRRVFGFPRVVGTYASSIVAAETWYPKRFDYKDGLRSGTISLGFNVAFNLFKEFVKK